LRSAPVQKESLMMKSELSVMDKTSSAPHEQEEVILEEDGEKIDRDSMIIED